MTFILKIKNWRSIENQMNRFVYQNAVVGIGLNINQLHFDDLSNAISLKQIIGLEFPVEKVGIFVRVWKLFNASFRTF